jgi:two-component system, LuxR family, response regulator FixJ
MTATSPTIFVIDDHAAVREALAEMLRVFGYAVTTYESADRFLQIIEHQGAGCVVADVRMPGTDGISLVRELAHRNIVLPVILISGHADVPMAVVAIKSGAEDFIEKPVDDAKLVAAINRALARKFEQQTVLKWKASLDERFVLLTPRQVEIFDLVVEGFTSHAIARRLSISVRTVESYRAEIMQKMQAESVAVLVRQAIRLGRITP